MDLKAYAPVTEDVTLNTFIERLVEVILNLEAQIEELEARIDVLEEQ